ncbi:hypothetical protein R1flu_027400 [Riccia fluitans]|uniref:RING-type E3 ubiquitin transferase n=1 Tax=Riccia fluitans TaxID=41844 RepID=A0ABD1XIP3_9MARC
MNSHNGTETMTNMSRVGLGYGIAIAVGILVLVSTIMLASYVCVRVHGRGQQSSTTAVSPQQAGEDGVSRAEWPSMTGLDQATLESYPKLIYSSSTPLPHGTQDTACSICLADYRNEEVLRMLPDCHHVFHAPCIDVWLRRHASCPMCRSSPLPTPQTTPISTPLSELIPLARHPLQNMPHV